MNSFPNILLLSGSGRNVGKTALGCALLKRYSMSNSIISIKFSPHRHPETASLKSVSNTDDCQIYVETSCKTGKDSSRYLKAGADLSYYVQCTDEKILFLLKRIVEIHTSQQLFIIESGALSKMIKAGVLLHVTHRENMSSKNTNISADAIVDENTVFENFSERVCISDNKWKLKY